MPDLRLLPLLAALLLLVQVPLHVVHTLDMTLLRSGAVHTGNAETKQASQETHPGHPGTRGKHMPDRTLTHGQDHSCCMPPAVGLVPAAALLMASAGSGFRLLLPGVQVHRLAAPQRARGPPGS